MKDVTLNDEREHLIYIAFTQLKTCPRCGFVSDKHHYLHEEDCGIGKIIREYENKLRKLPETVFN